MMTEDSVGNTAATGLRLWRYDERPVSALNTERLEKAQTQRCLSDVQLRYQGSVYNRQG